MSRPRVGFLGLGWIGLRRLEALAEADVVDVVCLADPQTEALDAATAVVPGAARVRTLNDLLQHDLQGVVIATPSGMHLRQVLQCLEHGVTVFCQKPLARSGDEARRIVDEARRRDLLLHVDMSYRHAAALHALREAVIAAELGDVLSVDLTFHNAYGPDKAWYYGREQAGGGCLLDLGVHLVDVLYWLWPGCEVTTVAGQLYRDGRRWSPGNDGVDEYALAHLDTSLGLVARVACSWRSPAGGDARIGVEVVGTTAALRFHNVNASFYDFALDRLTRTSTTRVVDPLDAWEHGAIVHWARTLAVTSAFDPQALTYVRVLDTIDRIYRAGEAEGTDRPRREAVIQEERS